MLTVSAFPQSALPPDSVITRFLYQLQFSTQQQQPELLNRSVNLDKLLEISFTELPASDKQEQNFISETRVSFDLGSEVINALGSNGHYTAMDYNVVNDTIIALYRIVGSGLNYHDYLITYDDGNGFEIFDVYVYATGEYLSETFRRRIEQLMMENPAYIERLKALRGSAFERELRYIEDIQKLPLLKQAVASRQYNLAHQIYDEMEVRAKQVKSFQLLHISAFSQVSDSLAGRYIQYYNTTYPDDPSLNLMFIHNYFRRGKYIEALASIDKLMASIGEDGYLEFLKSNIYQVIEDEANFLKHARLAIEYEPWLSEPYQALIDYMLLRGNFSEVVALMQALKKNTGIVYREAEMRENDLFKEFLESPEYARMKK